MRAAQQVEVYSGPLRDNSVARIIWLKFAAAFAAGICWLALLFGLIGPAAAQDGNKALSASPASVEQFRMASRSEEIALARSAAARSHRAGSNLTGVTSIESE